MTLTDAGPLIAILDSGEPHHLACSGVLEQTTLPLATTWPAFTEAMHMLGRAGGIKAQQALWRLVDDERLLVTELSRSAVARTRRLMTQYADKPMDLADATLVAYAEEQNLRTIFTLDADFHVYRLHGRLRFRVVPEISRAN